VIGHEANREVRVMRSAEAVLNVLRERGRRGLPCERLYRQLFNPKLYLLAYGRLYSNQGAMTPGVTPETVDGMSTAKIERIIDLIRHERYRFAPVRRVYIPKRSGAMRPLGMPTWSDKLVGEVVRLLLEAYYEPTFSDHSHGFRPGRGCHTALQEVANTWRATTWFIEGDISNCFSALDHSVMRAALAEKIHDNRFLRLVDNMLRAGYLEDWIWNATLSGAPQGGVASPILSNIYLDKLDKFVETVLVPEYTRGKTRRINPAYRRVGVEIKHARCRGERATVRQLRGRQRSLPSMDPTDPDYRRLRYVRYCDDILLGFAGPKAEAEDIKARLTQFLRDDLALELNQAKTLVTHARTSAARFLSYEISVWHDNRKLTSGGRSINGEIRLGVPRAVINAKCAPYLKRGQPASRPDLVNHSDYHIVADFGAKYRGVVQYYLPAANLAKMNRLRWVMLSSMLRTLAHKHKSTVTKMADKYKTTIDTPYGPRRSFEATHPCHGRKPQVARFGDIQLVRQKRTVLNDRIPARTIYPHKELIDRLLNGRCEICHRSTQVQVHHVRRLADLVHPGQPPQPWVQVMAKRRRKTLVVCRDCHDHIHGPQP